MDKKLSSEVYFIDGCIVKSNYFYVATQLEEVDPTEYAHTRMSIYFSGRDNHWSYHDADCNMVSVCFKKSGDVRLCALSKEGEVEFYYPNDDSITFEKIPDAGLRLGDLGYLTCLREICQSLIACGQNDQVYQRIGTDQWRSLTTAPLKHDLDELNSFNCIAGFAENDLYVVGDKGRAFHYDGKSWTPLSIPVDEHLQCVRCYSQDEVWICGYNGTLLHGNVRTGFKNVSAVTDNDTFWSLAKFQDKVYVATLSGLFVYDGNTISPVNSGLSPEIETYTLDANDEALWSFGGKDIITFDGKIWSRIQHPDNPPV